MDDISNVSYLKNTKPSDTSRKPSGPLTMTLRSKHRQERQTYDTQCDKENRKLYFDDRTIQKRTYKKRKACEIDEGTTTNIRPKKKRKRRRKKWGNRCKQKNKHREKQKEANMEAKQEVSEMNLKIKELNNKKMSWGDYRLLKKYECIKQMEYMVMI
eukprot:154900_1